MSYRTITIFSKSADCAQRPVPFVGSILIHGLAVVIIGYGIMYEPLIIGPAQHGHYSVRRLDFSIPIRQLQPPSSHDLGQHRPSSDASVTAAAKAIAAVLYSKNPVPKMFRGPHTLIQSDLKVHLDAAVDVKVPTFVIWRPTEKAPKSIVPPLQTSSAEDIRPSITAPNLESDVRNIAIAGRDLPARNDEVVPGTSTPVLMHTPTATRQPAVTASQSSDEPTPAAVMSISDLTIIGKETVLPPVNETEETKTQDGGGEIGGQSGKSAAHKAGEPGGHRGAAGTGQPSVDRSSNDGRQGGSTGAQDEAGSSRADAFSSVSGYGPATVIALSKEGRFGAVIVGTSLEDRFPELEGVWSGRLIYTVYLHVGLPQTWILQYSLPRSSEAIAGGNVAHLEAPWPYSIVRPDLSRDSIDADALIVNGFINQEGRFETLRLIFPVSFSQFDFVRHCLEQWQFRPGTQNGHPTRLEVMLIIPDQEE